MNKNRFRIIFNVARRMMMVVAEFVKSHMAGAESTNSSRTEIPLTKPQNNISVTLRPLAFSLMCALSLVTVIPNPFNVGSAHAEAKAATNVPGNQRPTVLSAPNGVEVVNIQTPSAAGVSRNVYEILNVPEQGMIFNNSRTNVQTELGGWIQGNPWLATGSARIILNEINSSNPSYLNGYMEIAGSRAELIIANPNGISCNGCGFINASRGVLTTGTPILSGGDLTGYRVTGGTVNIWGNGLDASRSNYTDIIARAVEVNAGIWANDLKITTGANQVDAANTQASIIAGSGPAPASGFALDVSALGGMYAGKITLIGTEAGLGVRNAGVIGASSGNLTLTADGRLENTNTIIGSGNITIATTDSISNTGTVYAQGNTSLSTQGDIDNSGLIAAQGNANLMANGAGSRISNTANSVLAAGLQADGTLTTSGNLNLSATQSITALGQNLSAGDQTLTAKQLDISGSNTFANNLTLVATNGDIQAQNATVSASQTLTANTTQILSTDGATIAASQLNLTAHDLSNIGGELVQTGAGDTSINLAGDLNNNQGRIATNSNNLTLAAQTLTNTGGSIEHAGAGKLEITSTTFNGSAGQIISNGALDLTATTATLDNGSTIAKRINVDTATLSNRSGEIIQTGSDATSISASISLDNTNGIIAGNGTTTLTMGDLINQGGTIQVSGQTAGTSNLTINATGAINNTSLNSVAGNINAGGTAIITADSLNNTQGQITAGNMLDITTSGSGIGINNTQGLIASNQALTLSTASLNNSSGTIASVHDDVTITANIGSINNSAGQISAAQNLSTSSYGLNNTVGTVSANSASINTQLQTLDNSNGSIITNADLELQTGALINDNGLIQSGANLVVNTNNQTLTNINSGASKGILALGSSTFTTGDLNNQTGYIGARGAITANSANINNNSSAITSEATVTLTGSSLDNQSGKVQALGNVDINTTNNIDNRIGLLRSAQNLTLTAASVDNRNTQGLDQGIEGASVSINADQINNASGAMRADNVLAITGSGSLDNSQGNLSSADSLNITDRLANANSNVNTKTLAVTNTGGTIIAGTGLNIDTQSLTGDGKVLSQGDLTTKLTTDYTHSGEWQADGNATFITTGSITNQAKLLAGGNLDITAANLDNQAAGEIAGANLNIAVADTLTNRGLLDGSDTFINTSTLNNVGTGRIYGDHVAIAATTLNNAEETVNGVTTSAVIAARDRMDIGAQTINNRNGALLFSAGDMAIGGSLDVNHLATGPGGTLDNSSANIEALGNLSIDIANLNNKRTAFSISNQLSTVLPNARELLEYDPALYFYWPIDESNPFYWRAVIRDRYINHLVSLSNGEIDAAYRAQLSSFVDSLPYEGNSFTNYAVSSLKIWQQLLDKIETDQPDTIQTMANTLALTSFPLTQYDQICFGDECSYVQYVRSDRTDRQDVLTGTPASLISAGGDANIAANTLINEYSTIQSSGDLVLTGTTLTNRGAELYLTSDYITSYHLIHWADRDHGTQVYASSTSQLIGKASGIISAGGNLTGSFTGDIDNITIRQHSALVSTGTNTQVAALNTGSVSQTATGANNVNVAVETTPGQGSNTQLAPVITNTQTGTGAIVSSVNPNTTIPNNSLFHTNPSPTAGYYVETDPRFANYKTWLSSDYMLKALSYDPATVQKRLGDGFYEQRLIREQINQLTGRRFLTGYSSDEEAYRALMTNGITFAQQYQLIPGVALTAAQIAQLTSDIVWLVEQTITLADGTTVQALVPQVYVRLQAGDIDSQGALLAGQTLHLNTDGNLTNSGSIAGRDIVTISADTINVIGGRIQAGNQLVLQAEQDINLSGTTNTTSMQQHGSNVQATATLTQVNRLAGLYVTNPNGLLLASAGNDITLNAAEIINNGVNGTTIIDAGNNLNLGTITATSDTYGQGVSNDGHSWSKTHATTEVGSSIQTQGDITLNAGNDLSARAANVTSEQGALNATAGNNLTITSGEATYDMEAYRENEHSGFLSSSQGMHHDTVNSTDVISSTFSADTVNLNAGNDITVSGSNVVGTNDVNLNAQNNITITSAQATHDETHYAEEEHSGFSASSSSISYGSSSLETTNDTQQVINVGSTVGSVQGDVNINAGSQYTQTASDVLTPQGDINITAQSVDINAATDTYANQQSMEYEQTGITLSISNPVISAAQTVNQMTQAASQTSDSRMQALAAGTSALAINNAANAVQAGQAGNIVDQAGGINVSLSIGTSEASSSSSQSVNTASGSTLNAGGNINITATGDGTNNPDTGNINVTGSQITAAHDVTLTAQNELNLQAAQNTQTLASENENSSASIGVSVNLGANAGIGITAGISSGNGNADGNDVTWTETQIQGGNNTGDTVTLNSGTDTNLIGAQVSGNQVVANIGTSGQGSLNIESLQDSSTYDSQQESAGISVTVPVTGTNWGGGISSANSNINSNYASVNEQAGIFAGDESYQVNVNGNTNLTGAAIASTDKAIQDNKNSLTTQTLTTSNIENSAAYEAEGYSVAAGVGTTQQPNGEGLRNTPTASAGISELSDDSSSVTISAISGGTVNITNNTQQQNLTGQDATTTVAMLNRDVSTQTITNADGTQTSSAVDSNGNKLASTLTPVFDQAQVQSELDAQIQITQAFSQVAPKAVGDYAASKLKEAANMFIRANDLNNGLTDEQRLQLVNEANELNTAWKDGGYARVALHAVVGGLTGNLEGAIGAGTSAITIPLIGQELAKLDIPATLQQALVMGTAAAIGGAVGGTAGAGAALSESANNYLTHNEVSTLTAKLKECKKSQCINDLLRDAIMLSESRDGSDLSNRALYEAAHAGTIDLIALAVLDPNLSFMVRQAASMLLEINMTDEGIGQQNYNQMLAAQLALMPTNGATIGVANSNVVSPEQYAQNGQDALAAGLVIGTLGGAMATTAQGISLVDSIVLSTLTNTGLNVRSQLNQYGEIKYPAELAINAGFGVLEGILGKYSGSGFKGVLGEAAIGANSNMAAMLIVDQYYQDTDHQIVGYDLATTGAFGALFGGGVKAADEYKILQYLKQFIK